MIRLALATALLTLALAAPASAAKLLPPKNKVYTGVTGSNVGHPVQAPGRQAPAVFGFFT